MEFDGIAIAREASKRNKINLCILVAETSLWANPEVHKYLVSENETGAFFPGFRRYLPGEKRREDYRNALTGKDETTDDNTYANNAIKRAIGVLNKNICDFETCHIWPRSCYDVRYHTAIANLVLIPRPFAGLSDHDPEVLQVLQFRSFELYEWHPKEQPIPVRPLFYPTNWLDPMLFTDTVKRSLDRRKTKH